MNGSVLHHNRNHHHNHHHHHHQASPTSSLPRGPEQHHHTTRFADYFVICGLDNDSGLEPDKYFGECHGFCLYFFFSELRGELC